MSTNKRSSLLFESIIYPSTTNLNLEGLLDTTTLPHPTPKSRFTFKNRWTTLNYVYTRRQNFNAYFSRESGITNFFFIHNIDIPLYLKPSPQRLNILAGEDERRLVNLLMKDGKRDNNIKTFTQVFLESHFRPQVNHLLNLTPDILNYLALFGSPTLNHDFKTGGVLSINFPTLLTTLEEGWVESQLTVWQKLLTFNQFTFTFNSFFKDYLPLFSFYVQKTDKNILKYSRGRSSKYSLVWKYVPSYNRKRVVSHWLKKEVKLQKHLNYKKRLAKVTELFLFNPSATLTARLRRFVHRFVFIKYKKRLLKPLNAKG